MIDLTSAALITGVSLLAAGLLSVLFFPVPAIHLLGHQQPDAAQTTAQGRIVGGSRCGTADSRITAFDRDSFVRAW